MPLSSLLSKPPAREWPWSGHREYLGMAKQRSIDPGPMQRQLATPGQYEEFGREGVKGGYRAEWYPSESILFLEPKKFVKRVEKRRELSVVRHPPLLEVLWQEAAEQA